MTSPAYTPLHIHSEYSILDGSIKVKKLVQELADRGHSAAALTDHDGLHGVLEFYLACKNKNINGIIGYEVNVAPVYLESQESTCHLVLLAKNTAGYKNLIKICTIANTSGKNALFTDSTNIFLEDLKKYSDGLIVLTGCMQSELSQHLLNNDEEKAFQFLNQLEKIFSKENVFVELIDNGIEEQKLLIRDLVKTAKKLDFAIVATPDVHYLNSKDKETHLSLLAIKQKLKKTEVQKFPEHIHFHLPSDQEMIEKFSKLPEAIENTNKIAEMCTLDLDTKSFYMPKYNMNSNESENDCLIRLSREGLSERKTTIQLWMKDKFTEEIWEEYKKRLEYELDIMLNMNFSGYFLIVQDFINWAKLQNIPVGPGRGSAAGSLVSYALKITNIDPIRFNLLFERFLNPERVSLPDIDTDFCQERREDVLNYVYEKYGRRSVSQIATFGRMMAKNALKNLARITGWSFNESNDFAKLIPNGVGITLEQARNEEPKIQDRLENDERAQTLWNGAIEIEGTLNSLGVHAAGVIISDKSLDEQCPLLESDGQILTQFEHKYAEKVGLIKFDFLGLKTLTVIDKALKLIHENYNIELCLDSINLEDSQVYDMISTAHVTGVFQLESMGMRKLISDLKPNCFTDIVALLALFRPGPLGSGMVEDFVKRKHGETPVEYTFDILEPILKDTYGIIVYQEQVQKIASVLANYSLGEADLLRRAMGKKDKHEMQKQKIRFIEGSKQNGYNEEKVSELFDLLEKFAEYGFNKSHSAAYGWVTYQTAWLKTYYPTEFAASLMSCDLGNTDKISNYLTDCRRMKIEILPPCVNQSGYTFHAKEKGKIQFGLGAIKGIGENIIQAIIKDRKENGIFKSVPEFIVRIGPRKINKKMMESLVKSGSFDSIHINRNEIFRNMDLWIKIISKENERSEKNVVGIFDPISEKNIANKVKNISSILQTKKTPFWNFSENLSYEYAQIGVYLSGHPSDIFKEDIAKLSTTLISQAYLHLDNKKIQDYQQKSIYLCGIVTSLFEKNTKEGDPFLVFKLEDGSGEIECVLFSKQFLALSFTIKTGEALFLECKLTKGIGENTVKCIVQSLVPLSDKRIESIKKIIINTSEVFLTEQKNILSLQSILKKCKGNTPVLLQSFLKKDKMKLSVQLKEFHVTPSDDFLFLIRNNLPSGIQIEHVFTVV